MKYTLDYQCENMYTRTDLREERGWKTDEIDRWLGAPDFLNRFELERVEACEPLKEFFTADQLLQQGWSSRLIQKLLSPVNVTFFKRRDVINAMRKKAFKEECVPITFVNPPWSLWGEYINKLMLREEYGLTEYAIKNFIGEPHGETQNPKYKCAHTQKLWLKSDVEHAVKNNTGLISYMKYIQARRQQRRAKRDAECGSQLKIAAG